MRHLVVPVLLIASAVPFFAQKHPFTFEDMMALKRVGAPEPSPNGKWVAYNSNETGKWEIYVTSFPEAHGKWQVSTSGGEQPRWRADGKELFYLSSDGRMMATNVKTVAGFSAGAPAPLFQAHPRQPVSYLDIFAYDVTRDGQRFLINTETRSTETVPVTVISNWPAKLNK